MTDQITDTLKNSMRQIVDMAPDAPVVRPIRHPMRRKRPLVALASGFAAVIVTVGVVAAVQILPDTTNVGTEGVGLSSQEAAFAELHAAALAATDCIENVGLSTQAPVYHDDTATFAFTWSTGTDEQEAVAQSCIDTVFEPVNSVWMAAYGPEPTPQESTPDSEPDALEEIAARLKAEPISAAELKAITGLPSSAARSGYRVNRVYFDENTGELGVIMYSDLSVDDEEGSIYTCFSDYAEIDGVMVAGGARCVPTLERAAEMASFGIAISGACGPVPKDDPQIDGRWTLLSIWGIPNGVDTVAVGFGNGSNAAATVSDTGVAQMLWEDPEDIISIQFDGMTPAHTDYTSLLLPAIAIDCTPDDGAG